MLNIQNARQAPLDVASDRCIPVGRSCDRLEKVVGNAINYVIKAVFVSFTYRFTKYCILWEHFGGNDQWQILDPNFDMGPENV